MIFDFSPSEDAGKGQVVIFVFDALFVNLIIFFKNLRWSLKQRSGVFFFLFVFSGIPIEAMRVNKRKKKEANGKSRKLYW
jgi:hypothetical protein